jgi:membrane protein DedA with SNARE-associated domain
MDAQLIAVLVTLFVTHAIPFLTVPSWLAYIAYISLSDPTPIELALLIALAGSAAAAGKLVVFAMGRAVARAVKIDARVRGAYLDALVFLAAATPMPDDVLYIQLGVAGYGAGRFAALVLAGKVSAAAALAIYGEALSSLFTATMGREVGTVAMVIVTALISLALIKLFRRVGSARNN